MRKDEAVMELIKLLSNPVRVQVMQYLQNYGEATTKQISEALTGIPAPTLYRHINLLLKEEVLLIKEERKVRGSLERLLVINDAKITEAGNGNINDTAYQFLMEIYSKFQQYSRNEDMDPVRDRLSLRTCVLNLTDDKFDDFLNEIATVMKKYQTVATDEKGKLRSVSFISAPIEEGNE